MSKHIHALGAAMVALAVAGCGTQHLGTPVGAKGATAAGLTQKSLDWRIAGLTLGGQLGHAFVIRAGAYYRLNVIVELTKGRAFTYKWSDALGSVSTEKSPKIRYISTGVSTVKCKVADDAGNADIDSMNLTVLLKGAPLPKGAIELPTADDAEPGITRNN